MLERFKSLSRASKGVLAGIVLITIAGWSGIFQANRDVVISSEQALEIASSELDFEAQKTAVRMVRDGVGMQPVWAISFSVPGQGEEDFEHLMVVKVDAKSGKIKEITRE